MTVLKSVCGALAVTLLMSGVAEPAFPEVSTVIEQFVQHRFPKARQHFWVINQTTIEEDEVTVDVRAVAQVPPEKTPIEERFLLLIVKGELAAAQLIPLEGDPDCEPEEA